MSVPQKYYLFKTENGAEFLTKAETLKEAKDFLSQVYGIDDRRFSLVKTVWAMNYEDAYNKVKHTNV